MSPQHCDTPPDPWDGSAERHRVRTTGGWCGPHRHCEAVSDKVAVATIRSLRQVANRVSNWSQYQIGRLLQTLVTNDGLPRVEVLARVSNSTQAESSLRQSIARECAADSCALCTATTRHEDEGQSGTMPYPCEVVQAQIKLAEHDFINFSPTFLSQCMVVVRDVPMGSPLLTCAEPSLVRTLVPRLVANHDGMQEEGLPVFLTGLHSFYPLRQQRAVAAVHYVDGDGGVLVCEWFPGLHDSRTRAGVRTQHICGHNLNFVPFREANHDAIELGHT